MGNLALENEADGISEPICSKQLDDTPRELHAITLNGVDSDPLN